MFIVPKKKKILNIRLLFLHDFFFFLSTKDDREAGKNVGSIHKTTILLNRQVSLCTGSFIMTAAGFIETKIIQC